MSFIQDLKTYYKNDQTSQKIIFWFVGITLLYLIFGAFFKQGADFIISWFSLSAKGYTSLIKPWTYLTYAFIHAGFFHLLSNVIMLHFSAGLFYTFFKDKQFKVVFFGGVFFAGIIYILASILFQMSNVLVGASAGILAVLFAVVSYNPHYEIKLLLIGKVKLWMIAMFLIFFFIIQIPTSNVGSHIAHFGGSLFGWLYTKMLLNGFDLAKVFTNFSFKKKNKLKNTPFKKVYTNEVKKSPNIVNSKSEKQKRIDDILDKISNSGYDSLTKEEKDFLFRAGKN